MTQGGLNLNSQLNSQQPLLEVRQVSKTFGGVVKALDSVSLSVRPHETVGLLGANGAGKSTLMKILVGVHEPDAGELLYKGQPVPFPRNPKEAAKLGIAIVPQERGVVPSLKVYQFLLLGHEEHYTGKAGLQLRRMKRQAAEILEQFGIQCHVDDVMGQLPLSTRKMVEIAKAILGVRLQQDDPQGGSIILLDEPTAPLTIEERKRLLSDVAAMKTNSSFIFVTHIMQEVMEYMDRVFVLRDGRLVGEYDMSKDRVTEDDLTRFIMGREVASRAASVSTRSRKHQGTVLEADGLSKRGHFYDISFQLQKGECIGFVGPLGSGKSELIRCIAGLLAADQGTLKVQGQPVPLREPAYARLQRGIGYVSGQTSNELFFDWSISKNISILNIKEIVGKWFPFLNFERERQMAEYILHHLKIRATDVDTLVSTLSGGNKQKVTVGKWLQKRPDILLLEDPTIGIDVGSRDDIYDTLLSMKEMGTSIILVSDDEKEYRVLCDKLILLKQGRMDQVLGVESLAEVLQA